MFPSQKHEFNPQYLRVKTPLPPLQRVSANNSLQDNIYVRDDRKTRERMGRLMKVHSDDVTISESSLRRHVFEMNGGSYSFACFLLSFVRSLEHSPMPSFSLFLLLIALTSPRTVHEHPIWIIEMTNKVPSLFLQGLIGFRGNIKMKDYSSAD